MGMIPAGFQMAVPSEELQAEGQSVNDIREAYGIPIAETATEGTSGALPII